MLGLYFCTAELSMALPNLTVGDEIIMSQMVKESTSLKELNLFLKLFPNSPYYSQLEERLFNLELRRLPFSERKNFDPNKNHNLTWEFAPFLTIEDEITMSRLVHVSSDPEQIRLFLKIFPNSRFRPGFENRLKAVKNQAGLDEAEESFQEMEEIIVAESIPEKVEPEPVLKQKEVKGEKSEKPAPENEKSKKPASEKEKQEPEEDWSKYEIGTPTKVIITDTDGNVVETEGAPQGLLFAWSTEVWLDIGGGGALEYFTQKLGDNSGELQHLFLETHVRGRIFSLINWGVGYGKGMTTIKMENKPDNTEIIPGEGTMQSISLGATWGSFGLNYMIGNFTGSYQLALTSGTTITNNTEKWKGTINMITLEYIF